jgi:hypothetical protein
MTTITSFTRTAQPQPGGAAPGFRPNDNIAVDELSLYYAGRVTPQIGAFIELSFDGVAQKSAVGGFDIRHAREVELFGQDVLFGITVNNSPTIQDPWNSTPVWGFPYNQSALARTPAATTLADGGLAERVAGAGVYMLWNDLLYTEVDFYKGFDRRMIRALGQGPADDANQAGSFIPYARIALIKDWEKHHIQLGAYALSAGNIIRPGEADLGVHSRMTDTAVDATYQYITDATKVASDMLSAHATYIHEDSKMDGKVLPGLPRHSLNSARVDVSYSFAATVTPSVQYFRTSGTPDPGYWSTPNGSPNSDGMIYEVAYVPWGKPDSPFPNVNLRLAVQYVNYFHFDGTAVNARNNNNYYFSLWTAVKF